MNFKDSFRYNKAINYLTKWRILTDQEKFKAFELLLAHACQKHNLPNIKFQTQNLAQNNGNSLIAYFNGKDAIVMNNDDFYNNNNLVKNLITLYHEIGHVVYCYKYEKDYLRFQKANKHLNKLDLHIKLLQEIEQNDALHFSYLVHTLKDFPNSYELTNAGLEKRHYDLTIKLLEANYFLNALEQGVERFGFENAIFILRELNGSGKMEEESLQLLKQCYDKYYEFEKQTMELSQQKQKIEFELSNFLNNEINTLTENNKLNFKKALSIINFCAIEGLQDFSLQKLHITELVTKLFNSKDHHAITQLTRLPFIETEEIRDHFGTTKNASGLLLLETCVSSNLNKTLNYLQNCKLENTHYNYLQDISKQVKDKPTATKIYSFASKFYDLQQLNYLGVAHLADKEVVQNIMREKIVSENQSILKKF